MWRSGPNAAWQYVVYEEWRVRVNNVQLPPPPAPVPRQRRVPPAAYSRPPTYYSPPPQSSGGGGRSNDPERFGNFIRDEVCLIA
jgi:hypothetical protein